MKYLLKVAYDGTHYGGWQVQPNASSIQHLIEEALSTILRAPTKLAGSGRTDSGVHALEQTAHFTSASPLDLHRVPHSLNGLLPKDIRITKIEQVDEEFHARYSAKRKIYRYHIQLGDAPLPFDRLYRVHIPYPLDMDLIRKAAASFIGTHNFSAFSNEAHKGSASKNPVRTVHRLDITEKDSGYAFEFEGNGFLYKMVRNIMGTLIDIGRGKIPIETLPEIFTSKDRKKAGKTAPAKGLFLVKVLYEA